MKQKSEDFKLKAVLASEKDTTSKRAHFLSPTKSGASDMIVDSYVTTPNKCPATNLIQIDFE